MNLRYLLLESVVALVIVCNSATEVDVFNLIKDVNENLTKLYNEETEAKRLNEINIRKDFMRVKNARDQITQFLRRISADVVRNKQVALENEDEKRQLNLIPLAYEVLSEEDFQEIVFVSNNITNIINNTKLCAYKDPTNCNLKFLPVVRFIAFSSNDTEKVKFYWLEWRTKAGSAIRNDFAKFAELYRKAATMNGYSKPSELWLKDFGESSSAVLENMETIISESKPIFKEAHAHIREKMHLRYGSEIIESNKPVPQHLYLPFLRKTLNSRNSKVLPYSTIQLPRITDILVNKRVTAHDNFLTATAFLKSLGMPELIESYWHDHANSKANRNSFDQTHKAWNFYNSTDVKFSYSFLIHEPIFFNMFEAVSDIHYYQLYKEQVPLYQKEAVAQINMGLGKFFSLAASSPKYLETLQINYTDYSVKEARINRLYAKGLRDVFSIHILYALELFRLNLLDETIDIDDNCAHWQFFEDQYGTQPPVIRKKSDFDAAGVLRIKFDEEKTSFIYSTVLQYQLFEYYCNLTGEYVNGDDEKPLDLCDLSGHSQVGEKIRQAMSLGASVDFKVFLNALVGSEVLSINGLLEYYKPLFEWLKEDNKAKNIVVGWENANKCLP